MAVLIKIPNVYYKTPMNSNNVVDKTRSVKILLIIIIIINNKQ
jgi:hypothetical protein